MNRKIAILLTSAAILLVVLMGYFQSGHLEKKEADTSRQQQLAASREESAVKIIAKPNSVREQQREMRPLSKPIPFVISPEEAAEQITRIRNEVADLSMRRIRTSTILFNLAQNGYFDEAWDLIDPSAGFIREGEIMRIMEAISGVSPRNETKIA